MNLKGKLGGLFETLSNSEDFIFEMKVVFVALELR